MKLEICNDLSFEEFRHIYKVGNDILPSCTTVMKPLSREIYKDIDEETLKAAADRGTTVHQGFELYADFGVEDMPMEYLGYLEALKKFFADYKVKPIATEQRFYHKFLRFAGTADLIAKIGDETILVDYKTTAMLQSKLTEVQLAAYKNALKSQGINVDGTAVLHVGKDGNYKYVRSNNETEAWDVFLKLLKIHQYLAA